MSEENAGLAGGINAEQDAGGAGLAGAGLGGAGGAGLAGAGLAGAGGADTADGIADGPGWDEGAGESGGQASDVWELSPSEDLPIPDENLASFSAACREAGLSREQAEHILDWHKGQFRESQSVAAQQEAQVLAAWQKDILSDPDFGGIHYKATVADARRALRAFDPDGELRTFLRESRWQFNPAVIRAVARVGRAMGEHGFARQGGQGGRGRQDRPLEERMYPDMRF